MPCNSDHLQATSHEIEASKVVGLLDELETGKLPEDFGDGYDSRVYSKNAEKILKDKTPVLCKKLGEMSDEEIASKSLEMQMWWRDHKKADQERLKRELKEKKNDRERQALIASLSDHERKLLGL